METADLQFPYWSGWRDYLATRRAGTQPARDPGMD